MTRCHTEIIVGTGSKTRANKQGYRKFFPVNEDGEEIPTNLNIKVKYVSDFNEKILSLKQLTDLGWVCIYTTTQAYLRKQEDSSIMIPLQMKEDGMFYLRVKKIETANTTMDKDDTGQDIPILRKQTKWGINTNVM